MSLRTLHKLKGWALTPVHVGDGTTWGPEGYHLKDQKLERFDPMAVIGSMSDAGKLEYIKACKLGGVWQAQGQIRKAVDQSQVRETLGISRTALSDIGQLMGDVQRKGELHPFVRSGDAPILPGSSLKGALRTGWLAARASPLEKKSFSAKADGDRPGKTGITSGAFQSEALDFSASHTEQDPLRDVAVGDCAIAAGGTLLDKAHIYNLKGDKLDQKGQAIQMHFERLAALADREEFVPADLQIEIATLEEAAQKQRGNAAPARLQGVSRAVPAKSPSFAELRRACNAHHVALWFGEIAHFYQGLPTQALMGELLQAVDLPATDKEKLAVALEQRKAWLIRIGRFSHFESKSIEGLRHGEKRAKGGKNGAPGRSAQHMQWGGSRTVCKNGADELLPFGWIILFEQEGAPKRPQLARKAVAAPASSARSGTATAAPPRATAAPHAGMRFMKGDKVTNGDETGTVLNNVPNHATKMEVDFEGDTDTVNVGDFRRL